MCIFQIRSRSHEVHHSYTTVPGQSLFPKVFTPPISIKRKHSYPCTFPGALYVLYAYWRIRIIRILYPYRHRYVYIFYILPISLGIQPEQTVASGESRKHTYLKYCEPARSLHSWMQSTWDCSCVLNTYC